MRICKDADTVGVTSSDADSVPFSPLSPGPSLLEEKGEVSQNHLCEIVGTHGPRNNRGRLCIPT